MAEGGGKDRETADVYSLTAYYPRVIKDVIPQKHMNSRTSSATLPFSGFVCPQKFKQKTSLDNQRKKRHEENLFGLHLNKAHSTAANLKSSYCDTVFTHSSNRDRHDRVHKEQGICLKMSVPSRSNSPEKEPKPEPGSNISIDADICQKIFPETIEISEDESEESEPIPGENEKPRREFPCQVCSKRFPTAWQLDRHLIWHEEPTFKCPYPSCPKIFHREDQLRVHISRIHLREANFKSSYCERAFIHSNTRARHDKSHKEKGVCLNWGEDPRRKVLDQTPEPIKPLSCDICGKRFKLKNLLKRHQLAHSHAKNFNCTLCQRAFKWRNNLAAHIRKAHGITDKRIQETSSSSMSTKCSDEGLILTNDPSLLTINSNENCPETQKPLKKVRADGTSSLERKFPCSLCGKRFRYASKLDDHMVFHREPLYKCPHPSCTKSFHTDYNLRLHTNSVHLRLAKFKSYYCDRVFIHKSARHSHDKVHKEKGICLKVGESLRMKSLEKEQTQTEQNKSRSCDICGKRFRLMKWLKRHQLAHSHAKNFHCTHCRKAFKWPDSLRSHIRQTHGIIRVDENSSTSTSTKSKFQSESLSDEMPGAGTQKRKPIIAFSVEAKKSKKPLEITQDEEEEFESITIKEEEEEPLVQLDGRNIIKLEEPEPMLKMDLTVPTTEPGETKIEIVIQEDVGLEAPTEPTEPSSLETEFPCQVCDKRFPTGWSLRRHMVWHRKPSHKCPYPSCSKCFHRKDQLRMHTGSVHLRLANYKSSYCDREFIHRSMRDRHDKSHRENGVCLKKRESYAANQEALTPDPNPHACDICGKRFAKLTSLKTHAWTHSDVKNFHCEQCGKAFKWQDSLGRHLRQTHGIRVERKARVKPIKGTNTSSLERKFPCSLCGKRFRIASLLEKHMVRHGERTHKCLEPDCSKSFHTEYQLRLHTNSFHLRLATLNSAYCDRVFIYNSARYNHDKVHREKGICLRMSHGSRSKSLRSTSTYSESEDQTSNENCPETQKSLKEPCLQRNFPCDVCGKRFPSAWRLNTHMVWHRDPQFKCLQPNCSKGFRTEYGLRLHTHSVHLRLAQFKSFYCERVFIHGSTRDKHDRSHREKGVCSKERMRLRSKFLQTQGPFKDPTDTTSLERKFPCGICGKRFPTACRLEKHVILHRDPLYKCAHPNCTKSFYTDFQLRLHTSGFHLREANFKSSFCDRVFIYTKTRDRHDKVHRDKGVCLPKQVDGSHSAQERNLHCRECGRGFKWEGSLENHMRFAHDNRLKPIPKQSRPRRHIYFHCKLCLVELGAGTLMDQHMYDKHRVSVRVQELLRSNRRVDEVEMCMLELETLPGSNADPLAQWFMCDKCSWATSNVQTAKAHRCKSKGDEVKDDLDSDEIYYYREVNIEVVEDEVALIPEEIKLEFPDFEPPLIIPRTMTTGLESASDIPNLTTSLPREFQDLKPYEETLLFTQDLDDKNILEIFEQFKSVS